MVPAIQLYLKVDDIFAAAEKIANSRYIISLCANNDKRDPSRVMVYRGISYCNEQILSAGIKLEMIIPVLIKGVIGGSITSNMAKLLASLSEASKAVLDVRDCHTYQSLDVSVIPLDFKLGCIINKLYTVVPASDLNQLVQQESNLIDVLWLYSTIYEYLHQCDYDHRSTELSIH